MDGFVERATAAANSHPTLTPSSPPDVAAPRNAAESELEGLSELVDKLCSDDTTSQLEATVQFRKLLSDELNCDKNHPSGCPAQIC